MATITSTAKQPYAGGSTTDAQQVVGYLNSKNNVVRYTFKTDSSGASSVSWSIPNNYLGGGTAPALRWYITTSATSHTNAGSSAAYHGTVKVTDVGSGNYTFSGNANIVLQPNTTYYLWLFPSTTTYGYYNLTQSQQATITTSGAAGLVYIDNGSGFDAYQCFIDNGSSWDQYIPYIDNGSSWDPCG